MGKRQDTNMVLAIDSRPIVIDQVVEFGYSGAQARQVLHAESVRVVLVSSSPATTMTDPEVADRTYTEPITTEILGAIIAAERPNALLPTLGGRTALSAAIQLHEAEILEHYRVGLIGASAATINAGEDHEEFERVVGRYGAEVAHFQIVHPLDDYFEAANQLGYPLMVRPSFTVGGLGSGIAYNAVNLKRIVETGLSDSLNTEVLLEKIIIGQKGCELKLMRDQADNMAVICPIENTNLVGVHTGDSVTVVLALTLTDRELQNLHDIDITVIREVGVDTGGCNIQFVVRPETGWVIVIEMNP